MQRKFKVVEPKKDISIAKWVALSTDSQNTSIGSPRVTLSSRPIDQSIVTTTNNDPYLEINTTPKSVKILRSAVFFKDDAPHKTRSSKRKSNANKIGSVQDSTSNFDSQNVTPKVIFSPGIIRDTKAWRTDTTKCCRENQNSLAVTYRSFTSGSGTDRLDSSKILFKAEIRQNDNNVNKWVSVVSESKTVSSDDFRIPPTFSARMEEEYLQTENMSEAVLQPRKQSDMSNKVGENKKEIDKLKTELQTLINTNLKNKNVISQDHLDTNIENVPSSINFNKLSSSVKQNAVVSPSKTSVSLVSVRRKPSAGFSDIKEEPKSKAKTYDPETTREFIRKQKLRRKEKLQREELKKKESEELKKHKLEELKQKTLQLLTENVKKSSNKKVCAKSSEEKLASKLNSPHVNNNKSSKNLLEKRKLRARSFDRENIKNNKVEIQENINKTKENLCRRSRSVSREQKFCDKESQLKTRRSVRENKPNSTNIKSNPEKELEQVVNQISNLLNNKTDNIEEKAATKIQAAFRSYQQRRNLSKPVENNPIKFESNIKNISNKYKVSNEIKSNITSEITAQNAPLSKDKINIPPLKNNVLVKSTIGNIGNVEKLKTTPGEIIKSTNNSQSRNPKDDTAINGVTDATFRNKDTVKEIETIKQKLETSISQSNVENKRNEIPDWLLPASTLPYPYNFISAVRKKLEIATKSHTNVEKDNKLQSPTTEKFTKETSIQTLDNKRNSNVSIQCSLEYSREIKESNIPKVIPPKPEELKTFMSHKCRKQLFCNSPPKLKSPTNLKNIDKNITTRNKQKEHISIKSNSKTIVTSEASDSDTTKNIPEISEEEQFSKQYSVESDVSKNVKNITFDKPRPNHKISINNEKNFTIDQIKVDKSSSNKGVKKNSIMSDSDKLQNIIFDRQTNNSSSDIKHLIKPDYKMDTSIISRHQSNRSKYPSDIDTILSQYSKMKSSSIHNDSHSSQYSEDFNSSPTNHLSLPKSSNHQIHQDKDSSVDSQSDTKSRHNVSIERSEFSKIKSDILASLARQCSSSLSKISESLAKSAEITTNKSLGSHINIKKSVESTSDNLTGKYTEFTSKNTEKSTRNSTNTDVESLSKISSKVTEIKTNNSNNGIKEFSNISVPLCSANNGDENLPKNSSIINSNTKDTKTENSVNITEPTKLHKNTKSDVSEMKSKNNYSTSNSFDINTNPNISHSKKEISIDSSIPENSIALRTDSQSAEESNKSSIDKPLKKGTASVKTDSTIQSISDRFEHSESKSGLKSSNIQNLSKPRVNLKIEKERFFRETKNNPNQIHLKLQAEVHLLNSFNNSLQQVVAVEKSLLDMHDPQPVITVTRGCGAPDHMESLSVLEPSVCSQDFQMSPLSVASETAAASDRSALSETCSSVVSHRESAINKNPYVGVSLGMFDQMIRDEDNRLEHLKAILKLRDKTLFDRTKGEIAWLEIQKKLLRDNGQLNDVTIIKKKQRGLIIKLEQERHEMQRLKQAHKQATKERKNALREQKNIIKQQLSSTDQIPTKIRRLSHLERKQSGPVKVYRVESKTEHVRETTMSRNNSGTDETISVTTSSVVTQISEKVSVDQSDQPEASMALKPYPKTTVSSQEKSRNSDKHSEKVKRALLMKEADLEKRRKEAEELLKWHERLKQEEAQVVELERQAKSIQLDDHEKKRVLTGAQLNKIWKGITGSAEKKFDDHKKYQMSKRSLDKFYQNARKIFKEISEERNSSKRASEESYTSDFDASHSPSKINLSSSIMTQINETDISTNKMLFDKLRKISESSRLNFITSSKADTNISEHTTISGRSQLPVDKMSVVSEIMFVDQENETESKTQTEKDIHSVGKTFSSKSSVISELNVISDHESVTSMQSSRSEVELRKSSTICDIAESKIISDYEQIKISDVKESIQSIEENVRNSSTDSDLPELQIVSDHEHHSQKYKLAKDKESDFIIEEVSKNYNTDSDFPDVEISSEYDINIKSTDSDLPELQIVSDHEHHSQKHKLAKGQESDFIIEEISKNYNTDSDLPDLEVSSEYDINIKSTDAIESVLSFNEKSKNTDIQIKYENNKNSEQVTSNIESIQSGEENKSTVISELSQLQNISHQKNSEISSSEVSKFEKEYEDNKSLPQIVSFVESIIPYEESYQTDIKTAENILKEDNTHLENLTPTKDTNNSLKEIYTSELEQHSSENSAKTIEQNTSKIIDENILFLSDSQVPSDTEIKSEVDNTNRNIISAKEEIEQGSITVKSSYLQESDIIQSGTIIDENKIDSEKNLMLRKDINNSLKENYTSELEQHSSKNSAQTIEQNTSKIIDESILLLSDSQVPSDTEIKSEVDDTNRNIIISAKEEIEQGSITVKSSYLQESDIIQSGSIVDKNKIDNEKNLTLRKDTNNSLKEKYTSELEQHSSDNSAKTIEQNTSKIIDENILLLSDSQVPSDTEIKSEVDETNRNIIICAQEEIEQGSKTVKSSYLQESDIIQSGTIVNENKIDSEETLIDSYTAESRVLSEASKLVQFEKEFSNEKIESPILKSSSEKQSTDVSEIDGSIINDSETKSIKLSEESDIKSSISGKYINSLTQDTNAVSESAKECVDSKNKSEVDEFEVKTTSSLFESEEIISKNIEFTVASTEVTIVESKSKNDVEEYIIYTQNIVSKSDSSNKLIPINDLQIKESEINEKNLQSEVSTPHESEPYYQTDFEKISDSDYTTETDRQTKESNEEIDIDLEKDLIDSEAIENTESIKSLNAAETEKESITKTESYKSDSERNSITKDNSETFESEKESTTIIQSPTSHQLSVKENDIFELKSEVAVSPKSVSTEAEESNEDVNEISELQIEDSNVAGVSHIDVRKRVSEILADTTISRGDKSPRLQDLYVTTYDILTNSAESTPDTGSPTNEFSKRDKSSFPIEAPYRSEAEELLRKQLEIEQEIKQLERQQQQQNIPYLFMREIPNKPPPPYKPPNAIVSPVINSVIPVHADHIKKYVNQSADVLFQAYVNGSIKETFCKSNNDDKINSEKFIFDLCKEIALEVCKPIENTRVPSWKTQKNKFQSLISNRPLNKEGLCSVMNRKVLQLLNFEPIVRKDNLIIRWSRKKRDHVDEILVLESQTEETEWTNYDTDEQTIKDNMTSDIMDMLVLETAQVMCEILKRNKKMSWINYC